MPRSLSALMFISGWLICGTDTIRKTSASERIQIGKNADRCCTTRKQFEPCLIMLNWIFKKNKAPATERPARAAAASASAGRAAQGPAVAPVVVDWQLKLQAAMGDDTALLALAGERAPVDVKLAAITALSSEAALKLAEREHRDDDRRVHRLAKQRHLAQVALRETTEKVSGLIEAAQEMAKGALIPANRLVELDRARRALNATLIGATQRSEFDALLAHLTVHTRDRGDHTLKIERWTAEARHALSHLHAACIAAADGSQDRSHLATADTSARAVFDAKPEGDASASLCDSLRGALQTCARLDERLVVLDELLQAPSASAPATTADLAPSAGVPEAAAPRLDPALRWHQLPSLADPRLADTLNHRFEEWQQ